MWEPMLMVGSRTRRGIVIAALGLLMACAGCGPTYEPATPGGSISVRTWRELDLPGQSSALRGAVFDATCGCLWIASRMQGLDGQDSVELGRLAALSGTWTPSAFQMSADGFIAVSLALDAKDRVWLTWGQTVAEFDPSDGSAHSWHVPVNEALLANASTPGIDGNAVATVIDGAGELWIAAHTYPSLIGFNTQTLIFDRSIPLGFEPFTQTRLVLTHDGIILLNGYSGASLGTQGVLATVSPSTQMVTLRGIEARDFAVAPDGTITYADESGTLWTTTIGGGTSSSLPRAPLANPSRLVGDSAGDVWFSMLGLDLVGVGEIDSSGGLSTFPFPRSAASGPGGAPACDPLAGRNCTGSATFNPEIQALTVDGHGDVWIVTRMAGSGDPHSVGGMRPVYELVTNPDFSVAPH